MKEDLFIKNGLTIPSNELEISTSRAGGPGGQHVNRTSTRVTVRWNVKNSQALSDEQKERVIAKLGHRLTTEGDLIIHNSFSRSQLQNRKQALAQLTQEVRKALIVPKKRKKTGISKATKEERLKEKKQRSQVKKLRSKKLVFD